LQVFDWSASGSLAMSFKKAKAFALIQVELMQRLFRAHALIASEPLALQS
jgi:hypothetical protein